MAARNASLGGVFHFSLLRFVSSYAREITFYIIRKRATLETESSKVGSVDEVAGLSSETSKMARQLREIVNRFTLA